jgi:hypothetical protein
MTAIGAIARQHRALAAFALGSLVTFIAIGVINGSNATIPYLLFLLAAMWMVATLHARRPFSRLVLWGLAVWQLFHLAGGIMPSGKAVLYNVQLIPVILRYDQAVHAFGFAVATIACAEVLRARIPGPADATVAVMAALGGLGLGATNEVFEFFAAQLMDTNVGGYVNTGWDLVANTVGAVTAAFWVRYRQPDPRAAG